MILMATSGFLPSHFKFCLYLDFSCSRQTTNTKKYLEENRSENLVRITNSRRANDEMRIWSNRKYIYLIISELRILKSIFHP